MKTKIISIFIAALLLLATAVVSITAVNASGSSGAVFSSEGNGAAHE